MPLIVIIAIVGAFFLFGGCSNGSDTLPTPTTSYSSHDETTTNEDGTTTYHSTDNMGGDFSCTSSSDYSTTDCAGNP